MLNISDTVLLRTVLVWGQFCFLGQVRNFCSKRNAAEGLRYEMDGDGANQGLPGIILSSA